MRTIAKARHVALLASVLGSAACGDSTGEADAPSRSIFTDPEIERWELSAAPDLEIGGADEREGYALGRVAGAILLRDRLVIADAAFDELRFYSMSGELLARSGRSGGGPGEYGTIRSLARYDDSTAVVWDIQLSRLTLITSNGDVRGTIDPDLSGVEDFFPPFVGVLDDGRIVFRDERPTWSLRGEPTGERRDSVRYLVLEADGSRRGVEWKEPGTEVYYADYDGSLGTSPVIFGRSTLETIAGTSMVIGTNDSLNLEQRTSDGLVHRRAALPWAPTPATDDWVELERRRLLEETNAGVRQRFVRLLDREGRARLFASIERRHRALPNRRTLPAFSDLRADARGNIWVAEYVRPGVSERTWVILDGRFDPVAMIEIPRHIDVLYLGRDHLVGRTRDDLERGGSWGCTASRRVPSYRDGGMSISFERRPSGRRDRPRGRTERGPRDRAPWCIRSCG